MRAFIMVLLAVAVLAPDAPAQAPAKLKTQTAAAKNPNAPVAGYTRRTIQGFNLIINNEVFENDKDPMWKRTPSEVLELELRTIAQSLPDRTLRILRRLVIWVEWEDLTDPDVGRVVAKYYGVFGNRGLWQLAQTKHPGKANNVEIISMRSLTREHQPNVKADRCVILHELVHAVHFQLFGPQSQLISSTYRQAMDRGLYNESKDVYGRTIRPYASASSAEYFAELSCAYLNKLHYYPHDRDDLKQHDPAGYKLMEMTWGPPNKLEAVKKVDAEKVASARLFRARQLQAFSKNDEARTVLKDLIATYPGTKAAAEAKAMLEKATPAESNGSKSSEAK